MAIAAGDFSASQLTKAILKADQMWGDSMLAADWKANVDVYKAIKAEQTANVTLVEDSEKDYDVRVIWVNPSAQAAEDDDDDCDVGGDELHSDKKDYSLTVGKKWGFTVDEKVWRTNNFSMEDAVAKGFLQADKELSNAVCAHIVARIESFKGVNPVTDGVGTPVGSETEISATDWNERLFAYLYRVGLLNQFGNPFLLSGSNLFEERIITLLAAKNANGVGAAELYKLIRTYFDIFNVDTILSPDQKTYMINRGAIAFASKSYESATPKVYTGAGLTRYSIASRNLEGVRFDVTYTNRCTSNTMKHDFTVRAKFDTFLNPLGLDATRTGVLSFKKVA